MASSRQYLDYVLEQMSGLDDISYRAMMGEYILYYKGKVIGGVYDDRLLLKPVASVLSMVPCAPLERPYDGAKEMLLVEAVDDKALLSKLVVAVHDGLPAPKKKK